MTERKTIYNTHTSPHTPRMHLQCIGGQGCVCMMLKGRLLHDRQQQAGSGSLAQVLARQVDMTNKAITRVSEAAAEGMRFSGAGPSWDAAALAALAPAPLAPETPPGASQTLQVAQDERGPAEATQGVKRGCRRAGNTRWERVGER